MSSSASAGSEENKPNPKSRLPLSAYLKSNKNITFSYPDNAATFQHGQLGDTDTYLMGTLHLTYNQPRQVRSVTLHLKGAERASWYKAEARSKALYSGEQILVDQVFKIWEAEDQREVQNLDIPFKIKLPYNLAESLSTEVGSVSYILRATVNRKVVMVGANNQIVEVVCPLKKTLIMDNQNSPPYKLRGESRSGLDYTFVLPPNKNLNLGTYVSIPMRIRFLRPGISVERVEIVLKTCMDFRCNNPSETRHVKEQAAALVIPRQEIRYLQPVSHHYEGECVHTINLFIPRSVQPTYAGRFISITHQLCIKFCLWGADMDFQVEESVRVANILEKHSVEPNVVPQEIHPNISPVSSMPPMPPPPLSRPDQYPSNMYEMPGSTNHSPGINRYMPAFNPNDEHQVSLPTQLESPQQMQESQARNRPTMDLPPPFPYDGHTELKAPPVHPPPPVPPISTIYTHDIPAPSSPNSKLSEFRTPLSPPPYRQPPQAKQYLDTATVYAYDFDE